jgi:hypothetical protein
MFIHMTCNVFALKVDMSLVLKNRLVILLIVIKNIQSLSNILIKIVEVLNPYNNGNNINEQAK